MPELRPDVSSAAIRPAVADPADGPLVDLTRGQAVPRIWLSQPDVRDAERERLLSAVDSGWVAPAGPDLDAFETELADRCGVPFAVAVSSGTAALHLALLHVGVRRGDDVLLPTATFAATANAVVYCGARPCFVDVDEDTWQLSPELLRVELAARARRDATPRAVITVDLYGACADYDAILEICQHYGVPVVEDAAEALGATFAGRPAGSFGEAAILSFNGNKIITTSSGGALLLHDERSAIRARYLATQARQPATHYKHTEVGFNYRMSNLLAAFGRGQLETLDDRIARRREINAMYRRALSGLRGVRFQPVDGRVQSNGWLTCITVDPIEAGCSRDDIQFSLEKRNVESRPLWKPMHAQPVFAQHPSRTNGTADRLFEIGLCLPSGSGMSDDDVARVVAGLDDAFVAAQNRALLDSLND
jgi:dTDP-4-amino-4,6-dideoxygalactose transaminase